MANTLPQQNPRLQDKVAIVTGAGQGVGLGIARRLHNDGATVVIAEFQQQTGQQVASELTRSTFIHTDITQRDQVIAMVEHTLERYGRIDILVNNAYPTTTAPAKLENREDQDFEAAMTGGFMSAWWAMKAAFPTMQAQHWGRIINLCSLNGVNAHPYTAEYNSAKEGLRALSRTAAREWGKHGICVNILCPAAKTPAYELFEKVAPDNIADMLKQNPMGYMGDPEADIGGVAAFLASEDARYVTGNTLFADGGSHINGVSWEPPVA
ncbi:SDR family NAD(P)-dependent oxidoreductase [Oceanicoccus sp. KOV_DT_Chl]|uniref:SDR family NAD(P)-dependent oxidoreductase n=1 Tax=Oceanicoccus sp. KOV_DT_Chl TaxID=1904639 RepID=UPI000C79ADDF|nr:SDR family oxidoreductase [Oceanicoccus sp. KOV_DT_Chl]